MFQELLFITVQAQTTEYLEKKKREKSKQQPQICKSAGFAASTMYRNGIKKRNEQRLNASRRVQVQQMRIELDSSGN